MDAQTFLHNFATIAEAPDGVQRLRDLVLELAFRGRLTTADSGTNVEPSPRPASTPSSPKSAPFEIPRHWVWHRLDEIADYNKRPKVSPNTLPDSAWSLDLADIEKTTSTLIRRVRASERHSKSAKCAFERGDVLYGKLRPYLDKVLVADSNGYCTTEIVPIVPKAGIIPQYLRWSLKRPDFRRSVESLSYGMKMPRLGTKDALASLHPVPLLAEQERIVSKVDELMRLCDDLEARQERRHLVTTRFRTSALHALTEAGTPDDLHHAWERVSANWPALTYRPGSIADLGETVARLAIEGRLSSGHSDDDPAESILDECRRRKADLVRAGGRSRSDLGPLSDDEYSLPLPRGWVLARVDDWCDIAGGVAKGRRIAGKSTVDLPYLRVANVKAGYLALDEVKQIEVAVDEVERFSLLPGDVLLTEGGDWDKLGRSAIWTGEIEPCLHQNHVFRARTMSDALRPEWLSLYTNSGAGRAYFQSKAKRTTNLASINMTELRSMPLPVPPAAEQVRILRTLAELTRQLKRLDSGLTLRASALDQLAARLTTSTSC